MSQAQSQWLAYAIASGACAALNGVFAKLVTTRLTTIWADAISQSLGLDRGSALMEYLVRGCFFALNLAFNAVMWALFTRALTLGSSTVRTSVINTSANFIVTAVMGALVFGEALPGLWWVGAAFLVAGSVIIGRRDEREVAAGTSPDLKLARTAGGQSKPLDGGIGGEARSVPVKKENVDPAVKARRGRVHED